MREDADLAARHIVAPQDLAGQRLIGIQNGNQVDRQLREVCSAVGVEVETTVRGFFFAVVRRMISAGGGVALVDALNGLQALNDGVVWRRFEPRIDYRVAMITKAGAELSKPAKDFSGRLMESLGRIGQV
jgi:DNA-binding transcriptional LysR family regulator